MVAGTGGYPLTSVEIYNLASGIWRSAPNIRFSTYQSSTLSYGNSFALVGGGSDDVNAWTYDESNGVWYGLTDRMEARQYSAVIPVNEDMFYNCQVGIGEFDCFIDVQCHPPDK